MSIELHTFAENPHESVFIVFDLIWSISVLVLYPQEYESLALRSVTGLHSSLLLKLSYGAINISLRATSNAMSN